jgi:hypothetical protein
MFHLTLLGLCSISAILQFIIVRRNNRQKVVQDLEMEKRTAAIDFLEKIYLPVYFLAFCTFDLLQSLIGCRARTYTPFTILSEWE